MNSKIARTATTFLWLIIVLMASPVRASVWCYGTGGGGTGGSCAEFADHGACVSSICAQSGVALDPNCDPNVESCSACDCTCMDSQEACTNSMKPAGETFDGKPINLVNPLGTSDPAEIAARIIQLITGVTGSIALLMFVWGGFLWTTSAGNDEKVKKAKQIFTQSVLGLAIIFGAYALLATILRAFTGAAA